SRSLPRRPGGRRDEAAGRERGAGRGGGRAVPDEGPAKVRTHVPASSLGPDQRDGQRGPYPGAGAERLDGRGPLSIHRDAWSAIENQNGPAEFFVVPSEGPGDHAPG